MEYTKVQLEKIEQFYKRHNGFFFNLFKILAIIRVEFVFKTGDFAGNYYIKYHKWNPLYWISFIILSIINILWNGFKEYKDQNFKDLTKGIGGSL